MAELIVISFIGTVLTELLVEILIKSEIMSKTRVFFRSRSEFMNRVLACGYCTSVWTGMFVAIFLPISIFPFPLINWFITGLLYHRLSNYLHITIDNIEFNHRSMKAMIIDREKQRQMYLNNGEKS